MKLFKGVITSTVLQKYCKGLIVAARIYADVAGNKCSCGGKFTKRIPHPDAPSFIVPKCDKCDSNPPLYLLDVDTVERSGRKDRIKIRFTQNGDRLDSAFRAIFTINEIIREIESGVFDLRKYSSLEERKSLIFSNVLKEYLASLEKTAGPKYLKDTRQIVSKHIEPYFGKFEVSSISSQMIRKYRSIPTKHERTRDKVVGALRAIMGWAKANDYISEKPDFDTIPRSKKRKEIISMDLALKTINLMHKEMYKDMYRLMLIYPMRPCEVRALKWFNINFESGKHGTITIDHHFSDEVYLPGRKSIKEGEASSLTWNLNAETREIFMKYRNKKIMDINWKDQFIFINRYGNHVSDETLRDAWNNARKKAGHNFVPYVCRHRAATELYKKLGGDLVKLKKVGGWTNITTPGDTYLRPDIDMDDLF